MKTPGSGRKAGTPNKATNMAREAIAAFVDDNAYRLQGWLDKIADGEKDKEGGYVIKPDPEKAFSLFQSVIEYHIPKLARTDINAEHKGNLSIQIVKYSDNYNPASK